MGKGDEMARNNKTVDRIQAVWNILGGEEGVDRLINGGITVSESEHKWHEENGVIYFTVISDGTTGQGWIERLEQKGFRVGGYDKSVLHSPDFKPTNGVTTKIAVLKGSLFSDNDRITRKIRAKAEGRNLTTPNAEIACLIREKFSDEEMIKEMDFYWIVAMHESIKDSDGSSSLLGVGRYGGSYWLDAYCGDPGYGWDLETGFAFVVSQV